MSKRISLLAMFTAMAVIMGYVETLIPISTAVPGVKIGFANIVIVSALYRMSFKDACIINILRILIVGFLFGNMFSILYSLCGGICSMAVMQLLKQTNAFSIYSVSIAGGITHNIAQVILAAIILRTTGIIYYLGVLLITAIVSGAFIGIISAIIVKRWKGTGMQD